MKKPIAFMFLLGATVLLITAVAVMSSSRRVGVAMSAVSLLALCVATVSYSLLRSR